MEGDYRPNRSFMAPVKVGDEINVKIESVGEKGDGIAKKDGFVLFVPNTKEGDEVKIKITRVLRRVGFAEVVGEGSAPSEEAPAEEAATEETAAPEEAPAEDTENFGEEPAEQEEKQEE
jgi:predicted RNA-binding protein with TRAM domain